jgi:hypothetical protein
LKIAERAEQVKNYHRGTLDSFIELTGALGASDPDQLTPAHILHRMPNEDACSYAQMYAYLETGDLLAATPPESIAENWAAASVDRF